MQPAVLVRLRPSGPWRSGPAQGGQNQVDEIFRSDRLFSAVTLAMQQLGYLEEWLAATSQASHPQVTFTSLFPFQGELLFAPPPATLWPPPASLVVSPSPVFLAKIRWQAARFVPLNLIESLLTGQSILADQWLPDVESGCLLRRDRPSSSPFRIRQRSHAAVDRLNSSAVDVNSLACVEFESGSGLWCVVRFADEATGRSWNSRVQAALRLLAESGFGARRSSGWGHAERPEFQSGDWPRLLFPKLGRMDLTAPSDDLNAYWLLSLYSPAETDTVDWKSGDYKLVTRGGYTSSRNGVPTALKKRASFVTEGSVLIAKAEPSGTAVDVAPQGFSHPVYRSGQCVVLRLPERSGDTQELPVAAQSVEDVPVLDNLEEAPGTVSSNQAPFVESAEQAPAVEVAEQTAGDDATEQPENTGQVKPAEQDVAESSDEAARVETTNQAPGVENAEQAPAVESTEPTAEAETTHQAPGVENAEQAPAVESTEPTAEAETTGQAHVQESPEPDPATERAGQPSGVEVTDQTTVEQDPHEL